MAARYSRRKILDNFWAKWECAHLLESNEKVNTQKAERHYKIFLLQKGIRAFHDNLLVKIEEKYFEVINSVFKI